MAYPARDSPTCFCPSRFSLTRKYVWRKVTSVVTHKPYVHWRLAGVPRRLNPKETKKEGVRRLRFSAI